MHLPASGLEHRLEAERLDVDEPRQQRRILVHRPELAEHRTEVGMEHELGHEIPERGRVGRVVGIIDRDDLGIHLADPEVERARFPLPSLSARHVEQHHAVILRRQLQDDLPCPVRGPVVDHHDLQPVARDTPAGTWIPPYGG